jgi:hypothetical protein
VSVEGSGEETAKGKWEEVSEFHEGEEVSGGFDRVGSSGWPQGVLSNQ